MAVKQVAVGGFPFVGWLNENATNQVAFTGGAWIVEVLPINGSLTLTGVQATGGVGSFTTRSDGSGTIAGVSTTAQVGTVTVSAVSAGGSVFFHGFP